MPENGSVNGGAGRDAPDRPDSNNRGGAREEKEGKAAKADSFDRALDNANRPDRSPAAPPETTKVADIDNQNDNATDKTETQSERAAGPPGIGAPPSSPAPTDTDKEMTDNASFSSHRGYGTPFDIPDAPTVPEENDKHPEAAHQTDATNIIGVAGYAAAGGQAAIDMPKRAIDHFARHRAAQTLTRGNAGSLPVPGSEYATRADLGKAIKDTRITVDDALGKTPYGPNAQSTQQLNAATKPVSALGAAAKTVGWGLQPAAGALQGYQKTPEDAGIVQTGLNMARAAVKEVDDTFVSVKAGGFTAGVVTLGSASTGPAAPAVAIVGAPIAGVVAGIGAGVAYNDTPPDKAFDKGVDAVFDRIESAVDTVGDAFGYVGSQIDQWETNITEQAVRRTARGAND
ncbi:MAG: hypothetical protein ACRBM6_00590 [Geminicoccales bacterium]